MNAQDMKRFRKKNSIYDFKKIMTLSELFDVFIFLDRISISIPFKISQ